jgi:hypothetical protein
MGNIGEFLPAARVFVLALAMEAVARGEIEIVFRQASVIIAAPDLDFVGPLAEGFVVPLKLGNASGGKGPQFKTGATSGEGPGRLGNL